MKHLSKLAKNADKFLLINAKHTVGQKMYPELSILKRTMKLQKNTCIAGSRICKTWLNQSLTSTGHFELLADFGCEASPSNMKFAACW